MRRHLFLLLALFLAAGCTGPTLPGALGERELYTVLLMGDTVFAAPEWRVNGAVEQDDRTTVTWYASGTGAIAHMEYLHFDEGVTSGTVAEYYTDDALDVILSNYDVWKPGPRCDAPGVALYEFNAEVNDARYLIRLWAERQGRYRVLQTMVVFPTSERAALDATAAEFAPTLPACEGDTRAVVDPFMMTPTPTAAGWSAYPADALGLGPVVAAGSIDRDGCAVEPAAVFPTGTDAVYVVTAESDVRAGTEVFVRWVLDGEVLEDAPPIVADQDYEDTCVNFVLYSDTAEPLPAGQYQAEFIVNGAPAGLVTFEIR